MDNLNTVYRYHDATKHRLQRYARSLGYMDWATQPDPFLRFPGAPSSPLPAPAKHPDPTWIRVIGGVEPAAPLTAATISRLFWTSLALSAWKQVTGPDGKVVSRWSLRVNPSSGNLHPTEAWLACGAVPGVADEPALYHYRADTHSLEQCARIEAGVWDTAVGPNRLLLGLSSVVWREAWKYGERAFRYAQHDIGHALASVDLASAALGWQVRLRDDLPATVVGALLGCDNRSGPEQDHPDTLLEIVAPPPTSTSEGAVPMASLIGGVRDRAGRPEPLSPSHHPWEAIDEVAGAVAWPGTSWPDRPAPHLVQATGTSAATFTSLVRERRSAVAMDGHTGLAATAFYDLLRQVLPDSTPRPFALLPWQPAVSLVIFAHRIDGLEPGLYLLVRDPSHADPLRDALSRDLDWVHPEGCPHDVPLVRLRSGDLRAHARDIACRQDIAADGAFAVAMLARFADPLTAHGPGMYPRLFWETGVVGQMLYLAAEAAGLQGTGIGCFFDDEMHGMLGLTGRAWQSLYHFTVGRGVSDPRIQSAPAYDHLPG